MALTAKEISKSWRRKAETGCRKNIKRKYLEKENQRYQERKKVGKPKKCRRVIRERTAISKKTMGKNQRNKRKKDKKT